MKVPSVPITQEWDDAIASYILSQQCDGRAPTTISSRRSAIRVLARCLIAKGRTDPAEVTRQDMVAYMIDRQEACGADGTVTHHANVSSFFSFFSADEGLANPMVKIPCPKGSPVAPPEVLPDADLAKLVAACAGNSNEAVRNRALILLMASSGIRRAEVAALAIGDVNLSEQSVIIRSGKGGKFRTAVCSKQAALAISKWLRRRGKMRTHTDKIFTSLSAGGPMTPSGISQIVGSVGKAAGVKVHPHMFRHRFAHQWLDLGGQEHDLMQVAGWSSSQMISRYGAALAAQRAVDHGRALADKMS
jgi:site-specific recombinase XerD